MTVIEHTKMRDIAASAISATILPTTPLSRGRPCYDSAIQRV